MAQAEPHHVEAIRRLIPLWHAEMAWAKELLVRSFGLSKAEDILGRDHRGRVRIPGTSWFYRTHGVGVDIYKAPSVGGIDFDFDKPNPDSWRLFFFFEKQINDGALAYADYRELVDDEELLKECIRVALGEPERSKVRK